MGCTKSSKMFLSIEDTHELKKQINIGYSQDYYAKEVTKKLLRFSNEKHLYDKESQKRIDQLINLLLKRRELLDRRENVQNSRNPPRLNRGGRCVTY